MPISRLLLLCSLLLTSGLAARAADMRKEEHSKQKAAQAIREAQYRAALEKCGGLAGKAKVRCMDDTKTRYGKN